MFRYHFCLAVFFFTKAPRNTGIDPYTHTYKAGYNQHLYWKRKRNSGESIFPCLRDKDAVYDVVHCLYKHRDDCRQSHTKK
ncbi:hypothetical protein SDC9_144319 [bioreactor metagenome]|uniref:Uncharacterized protein n=1 Tax=bioreactor metagenome TaxID=1076179 RepID=A0A645E6G3_9ZZZZ